MKRGRFTEEQIIAVLRGHEAGRRLPTWLASVASRKGRFATGKPSTAACGRRRKSADMMRWDTE